MRPRSAKGLGGKQMSSSVKTPMNLDNFVAGVGIKEPLGEQHDVGT